MSTNRTAVRRCDVTTLLARLDGNDAPRVLDVRTPAELETAHIPGSCHVPLDTLPEHRAELRRHLDEVVAAGVLGSVAVPNLKWLARGVGAGLMGAALTDTCAMGTLLSKTPWNRRGATCDMEQVVRALAEAA